MFRKLIDPMDGSYTLMFDDIKVLKSNKNSKNMEIVSENVISYFNNNYNYDINIKQINKEFIINKINEFNSDCLDFYIFGPITFIDKRFSFTHEDSKIFIKIKNSKYEISKYIYEKSGNIILEDTNFEETIINISKRSIESNNKELAEFIKSELKTYKIVDLEREM